MRKVVFVGRKKVLNTIEAGELLGVGIRQVQYLCKTGKLKAKKIGPVNRQMWEIYMDGSDVHSTGRKVVSNSDGRTRSGSSGKKTPSGKGDFLGKKRKGSTGR